MNRRAPACVAAALALVVAGCESSDDGPSAGPTSRSSAHQQPPSSRSLAEAPSSAPTGACRLAVPADVATAFGADPTTIVVSSGRTGIGDSQCEFTLRTSNVRRPGTVRLTLRSNGTRAQLRQARRASPGVQNVSGVGDAAFYDAARTTLAFIRKTSLIFIQVVIRRPAEAQPEPRLLRRDTLQLGRTLADRI